MTHPADINAARERIRNSIYMTPCARSEGLSELFGCELYLKLENRQITGSFKVRGATNKILRLNTAQRASGVITASAGNHAQGVAHAAREQGLHATIVMPDTTPLAKIHGCQELGATIVLRGGNYEEAYSAALDLQAGQGSTFIHAFDDPDVIAGQGTIGLELLQQVPHLDAVVVPVGGGGLIAGIALAVTAARPGVRIIGVESGRIPAMQTSVAAGRVTPMRPANTIADGISVARVGERTLPVVAQHVTELVSVDEEAIAAAIMTLLEREKTLAEGAGAVGLAALSQGRISNLLKQTVVVLISGGNIDMTVLAKILERGMESDGRLARLQVIVPDKPGNIAELATLIADHHANILEISQNRSVSEVELQETEIELLLEARGRPHVEAITASIRERGYAVK